MRSCKLLVYLAIIFFHFIAKASAQTTYYPAQGVYNGFLGQRNVVECDNNNDQAVNLQLSLHSSTGIAGATLDVSLSPFASQHIILNDLAQISDSYGVYTVRLLSKAHLGDRISCRTVFYRPSANPEKAFDYAYAMPVQNPQIGDVGGIYNSIEPAGGAGTLNWLSVLNFDTKVFSATVKVYNNDGTLQQAIPIVELPVGGRIDIPLGHPIGQISGLYVVEPVKKNQFYDAFLIRYNIDKGGNYNFAFPLRATAGSCNGQPLLASTMGNGQTTNWLEIANATSSQAGTVPITIEVRNQVGELIHQERREIGAFSQSPLYLSGLIDPAGIGAVGSARVICDDPHDKLIIQSTYYGRVPEHSTIEWAYSSQNRDASLASRDALISAPVNTFLGMANWLKIADASNLPSALGYTVFDQAGNPVTAGGLDLPLGATADLGVHTLLGPDRVGMVTVESNTASANYSGELLRVMSRNDGQIGTIVAIPAIVQQQGLADSGNTSIAFRGDPQSLAPYRDTLTHDEAAHLLTRAAFGGSQSAVKQAIRDGLTATVNNLATIRPDADVHQKAIDWLDGDEQPDTVLEYRWDGIRRYWLYHMAHTPNPLREKMAFVWHDLLAASCRVVDTTKEIKTCYDHIELMRKHSLGSFRKLLNAVTIDYVMLKWLNGSSNKKESPDENFAREHWELFTLGEKSRHLGRVPLYSEIDIAEAARAYTGWKTQILDNQPVRFFVADLHDAGQKTLWKDTPYEIKGNFDAEDVGNLTLDRRPESARFIAARIFSALAHDHPSEVVVDKLATLIRGNNWNVLAAVKTVLRSEAMFSSEARNSRIKDPLTYAIGFLRQTKIPFRIDKLETQNRNMGLQPTNPGAVNGWPVHKPGKAAESEYFLAWTAQYANFVTEVFRNISNYPEYSFRVLLPGDRASSDEVIKHLAKLLDIRLTQNEREELLYYMDHDLNSQNKVVPLLFDARIDSHVRRKIPGLLWILSQHEQYVTF